MRMNFCVQGLYDELPCDAPNYLRRSLGGPGGGGSGLVMQQAESIRAYGLGDYKFQNAAFC